MIRLSPRLLIVTASALVGLGAHQHDGRSGGLVNRFPTDAPRSCASERGSWDVPLIQHCGYWAHFDYRTEQSAWPLPEVNSAEGLASFGASRGVIRAEPAEGDIFLQYGPRRRQAVHAGIVVSVLGKGRFSPTTPYYDVATIEGDTDEQGRLGGGVTLRVKRRLSSAQGDRFLRWADLEDYDRRLARAFIAHSAYSRRDA